MDFGDSGEASANQVTPPDSVRFLTLGGLRDEAFLLVAILTSAGAIPFLKEEADEHGSAIR